MNESKISRIGDAEPGVYDLLRLSIRVAVAAGKADEALQWIEVVDRLTAPRSDNFGNNMPSIGDVIGIEK